MNYLKGFLLILTLNAVVYGTRDIWPQVEFDRFKATQPQAMDVDTGGTTQPV